MDTYAYANATSEGGNSHTTPGFSLMASGRLWVPLALVLVTWSLVPGRPLHAQEGVSSVEVTGTQVTESSITAAVAVLDAASNPVVALTAESFVVQVDGQDVAGATVSSGVDAALPLGIVLTVDTSGSMAGDAIASARQSILPLVEAMQASDQAALLTFANEVSEVVPLTSDRGGLTAAIEGMGASGNTALFAGVVRASELAAAAPQPRRAVVLLSDGEDFGSVSGGITGADALGAARASGVPYFVVGLGQDVDQPFLTSLANESGGQYFAAADPAQLAQLYARISDRLRQQYTVVAQLPANLTGGSHRLTVSVGGVSGSGSFETADLPHVPTLVVSGLAEVLDEPTTISVSGVPAGAAIVFELNGESAEPSTGGALLLDPFEFAPGSYTLVVRTEPESIAPVTQAFTVPALPPEIVSPRSIPNLRPGDLVRLTIKAQPGDVQVRALVDGDEVFAATSPPYEFVLPEAEYEEGPHTIEVTVESAGGTATQSYGFDGPPGSSTNYAAYLLLLLVAVVVAGAAVFGALRLFGWYRARPEPLDTTGVSDQLAAWSELRRGRGNSVDAEAAPAATLASEAWGTLTVTSGPDAGKRFELRDDTELVGRGNFCSVRLSDKALEDGHFVLTRSGRISASTPKATVTVDGKEIRTAMLPGTSSVQAGATSFEVVIAEPQV